MLISFSFYSASLFLSSFFTRQVMIGNKVSRMWLSKLSGPVTDWTGIIGCRRAVRIGFHPMWFTKEGVWNHLLKSSKSFPRHVKTCNKYHKIPPFTKTCQNAPLFRAGSFTKGGWGDFEGLPLGRELKAELLEAERPCRPALSSLECLTPTRPRTCSGLIRTPRRRLPRTLWS